MAKFIELSLIGHDGGNERTYINVDFITRIDPVENGAVLIMTADTGGVFGKKNELPVVQTPDQIDKAIEDCALTHDTTLNVEDYDTGLRRLPIESVMAIRDLTTAHYGRFLLATTLTSESVIRTRQIYNFEFPEKKKEPEKTLPFAQAAQLPSPAPVVQLPYQPAVQLVLEF